MKQLLFKPVFCIALSFLLFSIQGLSQCLQVPVSLSQRVQQSALVAEGIVTGQRCVWDDRHENIYTIYTITPTTLFKGNAPREIEMIVPGGQIGLEMLKVNNVPEIGTGEAALFTLVPAQAPVAGRAIRYEAFAGAQGLLHYNPLTRAAEGVFEKFASVPQELYRQIQAQTGRAPEKIKTLDWNKLKIPGSNHMQSRETGAGTDPVVTNAATATPSISSFSPTSAAAGNATVLTINGSGFGSTQGTSYVAFKNADNGGSSTDVYPEAGQYVLWSDTQIQVEIPAEAGTGKFQVYNGTATATSASSLTVNYALTNVTYSSDAYFPKLNNDNSAGGYTFQYASGFASTTNAPTYFVKAIKDWICNSGVNWQIGSNTTVTSAASDGTNVICFGSLSTGTLATTYSRFSGCTSGSTVKWKVTEVDMVFATGYTWYYGTGTPGSSQYDFYSVALHELGHAHQLGHVINTSAFMHYSISSGTYRRSFTAAVETAGAAEVISLSTASANCSSSVMLTLSCTAPTVTLSTGATSISEAAGSTTVTATLSNRYYDTVTVNLSLSGTATVNTDYTLSTQIKIAPGSLTGSLTLTGVSDALDEDDETVIVDIASITNGSESGTQQKTVTLTDDDAAPTVTLTTAQTSITEANSNTHFTLTATLSAVSGKNVIVYLGTGGTATYGTGKDFFIFTPIIEKMIVIAPGETSSTTDFFCIPDALYEETETAIVSIDSITNATENGTQSVTISILDNDTKPSVTIAWSKTSIGEAITGNSNAVATLSAVAGATVTVNLTWAGTATLNTDYTVTGSTITIPAGSTSGYVTMNNIPDTIDEGSGESIGVIISSATNATLGNPSAAWMTQNDDDPTPAAGRTSLITETVNGSRIGVTPNPFRNSLTVRGIVPGSTVQLANLNGYILAARFNVQNQAGFNTAALAAGTYFIIITEPGGRRESRKVLKQ